MARQDIGAQSDDEFVGTRPEMTQQRALVGLSALVERGIDDGSGGTEEAGTDVEPTGAVIVRGVRKYLTSARTIAR
jgi:hypothetical protein